jgi:hypothetical protein
MATYDVRSVLRAPGRLCYSPTDLSTAWPHGGTGLGAVRGVTVRPFLSQFPVTAEERGGEPVEFLRPGEWWGLSAFLRGWDPDAVGRIFPNTVTGTVTQHPGVEIPGSSVRAGHRVSDNAVKVLFTPDNTDDVPAVLFYAAVPALDAQAELYFGREQELGMPVIFYGLRDSSERIVNIKRLKDLSL